MKCQCCGLTEFSIILESDKEKYFRPYVICYSCFKAYCPEMPTPKPKLIYKPRRCARPKQRVE